MSPLITEGVMITFNVSINNVGGGGVRVFGKGLFYKIKKIMPNLARVFWNENIKTTLVQSKNKRAILTQEE